jgi:hypothetical protein
MPKAHKTWWAMAAGALLLAACAIAPAAPQRRETLARQIAEDAAAFNEAYARAVSAQLLLNILRARDRQPRYYLSMSGIQDAPSLRFQENVGAGSVPLGEGASPWGFGSFGITREVQSRPTYAVQPLSADTLTKAVFQPTPPNVFAHYWQSGWSRDLLVFLLVDRIDVVETGAGAQTFHNEANEIRQDCAPIVDTGGCRFVRTARAFLDDISARAPDASAPQGQSVCGLVESYGAAAPVRAGASTPGEVCMPRFIVGARTYVMTLRSFDDVVYYVGELMRLSATQSGMRGEMRAPLSVRAAGLRGGGVGVPLFRIAPAQDAANDQFYAGNVMYNGQRFVAGPPVGRSCADAAQSGLCVDGAVEGDRSSSVLSLLAELLALNQSPDAIRAPSRVLVQ